MAETVQTWAYPLADVLIEAATDEPVQMSETGTTGVIRSRIARSITIRSAVPNANLPGLVASLRANTLWSIGGLTYQLAGVGEVQEADHGVSLVTATFSRTI